MWRKGNVCNYVIYTYLEYFIIVYLDICVWFMILRIIWNFVCSSLQMLMMWTSGCWTHCGWCPAKMWDVMRQMYSPCWRNTRMLQMNWRTTTLPSRLCTSKQSSSANRTDSRQRYNIKEKRYWNVIDKTEKLKLSHIFILSVTSN